MLGKKKQLAKWALYVIVALVVGAMVTVGWGNGKVGIVVNNVPGNVNSFNKVERVANTVVQNIPNKIIPIPESTVKPAQKPADPHSWKQLKILCYVVTQKFNPVKIGAIRKTWGKRCNKLLIMSHNTDETNGLIGVGSKQGQISIDALMVLKGLEYAYKKYSDEYDWYMHVADTTYVVVENVKHFLARFKDNPEPVFITHKSLLHSSIRLLKTPTGFMVNKVGAELHAKWNWRSLCLPFLPQVIEAVVKCFRLLHVDDEDRKVEGVVKDRYYSYDLGWSLKGDAHQEWPPKFNTTDSDSLYPLMYHNIQDRKYFTLEFMLYRARLFGEAPNDSEGQ